MVVKLHDEVQVKSTIKEPSAAAMISQSEVMNFVESCSYIYQRILAPLCLCFIDWLAGFSPGTIPSNWLH